MATAKTKAQETQNKAEETFHAAEEAASESIHALKGIARETLNENAEKIKSATDKAESVIKERPLLTIGCAFLAGWAVSKLIK